MKFYLNWIECLDLYIVDSREYVDRMYDIRNLKKRNAELEEIIKTTYCKRVDHVCPECNHKETFEVRLGIEENDE